MSKLQVVSDFWLFLKETRKLWLAPVVIVLLLVGFLLAVAKGSAVGPFIYSLF